MDEVSAPNQSQFAKLKGVSRKTVTIWVHKGLVVLRKDGRVDVAASEARLADRNARYRGGVTAGIKLHEGNTDASAGLVDAVAMSPEELAASAQWTLTEALRIKENFLARLRRLEFEAKSKTLVPLAKVKLHVEKAFVGYRQAMQRLPSRHAAAIAAELGVDPALLDAAMSKAIHAELTELSGPAERLG